jgi:5'-nucleotidase / UDP-sugar diphosphatase
LNQKAVFPLNHLEQEIMMFIANKFLPALAVLLFGSAVYSDSTITIIHTSDLHSHFTSHHSPRDLGGYARVKTKIDQIRAENQNTLLLDGGDWSEGNIFFTLNSGESSQRMLEVFGYDAIVLGNHDWLIGPRELYQAFKLSGLRVPVLSANLDLENMPRDIHLKEHIRPYVIKNVGGKRIGIFGLSTFQVLYDHFFFPARPINPIVPARQIVKALKEMEKCDVVIALTHVGLSTDKILAKTVPGLDAIVGGHSHILLKEPLFVNGVPLLHVGQWGQHVGEYELTINSKNQVLLTGHKIHQIDSSIPEDPLVKKMTSDFGRQIEAQFKSPVFRDRIIESQVDLSAVQNDPYSNDALGNWSVDAVREAGGTQIAFESPMFASTQLFKGFISTADIFDLFPHVYSKFTGDSWTIHTYDVRGIWLKTLLSALTKFGVGVKMSNVEVIVDEKAADKLHSFKVGGKPLKLRETYTVSSTRGILDVFRELRRRGIPFGPDHWVDTQKVMWREVSRKLKALSPITPDKIKWDGRMRTLQPDPSLNKEYLVVEHEGRQLKVNLKVINAGMTVSEVPELTVMIDKTPSDSLDDTWAPVTMFTKNLHSHINPGEGVDFFAEITIDTPNSFVPLIASIKPVPGEVSLKNNVLTNDLEAEPVR